MNYTPTIGLAKCLGLSKQDYNQFSKFALALVRHSMKNEVRTHWDMTKRDGSCARSSLQCNNYFFYATIRQFMM